MSTQAPCVAATINNNFLFFDDSNSGYLDSIVPNNYLNSTPNITASSEGNCNSSGIENLSNDSQICTPTLTIHDTIQVPL